MIIAPISRTSRKPSAAPFARGHVRRMLLGAGALTSLGLVLAACGSPAPNESSASSSSDIIITPPGTLVGWNTAWDDTGLSDTAGATPVATTWGANRLDLFTRNGTGLSQKTWGGGTTWVPSSSAGWNLPVKAGLASDPSGMGTSNEYVDLVWRTATNTVEHMWWDTYVNYWQEENLGGGTMGRPTIVIASDRSRGDMFARYGTELFHRSWVAFANNWLDWELIPVTVTDDPVAVSDTPGRIEIFYRATNGSIDWASWDGTATGTPRQQYLATAPWTTHPSIGGYLTSSIAATASGPGNIEVAGTVTNAGIFMNSTTNAGQTWAGWSAPNGCSSTAQVALTSWGPGREDLFAVSSDTGTVMHKFYGANLSLAPGLDPVCCGHDGASLNAVSSATSITVTFANQDDTSVTVTATNEANASDTHSSVVSGSGTLSYTFNGLQPSSTYLLSARPGTSTGCGLSSEGTIATLAATKTFSTNGSRQVFAPSSTGTAQGTMDWYATVNVHDTGAVDWTVVITNDTRASGFSYELEIPLPNTGVTLDLRGQIGAAPFGIGDTKASTQPGTQPVTSAVQMAEVQAQYAALYAQPSDTTLQGFLSATELPTGGGASGGSACPGGGPEVGFPYCCYTDSGYSETSTIDACSQSQADAINNSKCQNGSCPQ